MTGRGRQLEPGLSWAVLILYVGLIFYLSSRPHRDPFPDWAYSDKLVHFVEYGILGFLSQRAASVTWRGFFRRHALVGPAIVLLVGVALAALDEALQAHVPTRVPSLTDLLADAAGLAAGLVLHLPVGLRAAGRNGRAGEVR